MIERLKKWEGSYIVTIGTDWLLLGRNNRFLGLEISSPFSSDSKELPSKGAMVIDIDKNNDGYDVIFLDLDGKTHKQITVSVSDVLQQLL